MSAASTSTATKSQQRSLQQAKALEAIAAKKQDKHNGAKRLDVPEIDFAQHQLENGDIVRTDERVVKDVSPARDKRERA